MTSDFWMLIALSVSACALYLLKFFRISDSRNRGWLHIIGLIGAVTSAVFAGKLGVQGNEDLSFYFLVAAVVYIFL